MAKSGIPECYIYANWEVAIQIIVEFIGLPHRCLIFVTSFDGGHVVNPPSKGRLAGKAKDTHQ